MKITLGNVTQDMLNELAGATSGTPTVVGDVTRIPVIGNTRFSAQEVTITTLPQGNGDLDFAGFASTLVLKSGERLLHVEVSEFRYEAIPLAVVGNAVFDIPTAARSLAAGLTVTASFVSKYLSGDDTLQGNGLANNFSAGAGNDRIIGGAGSDTIDGGAGTDTSVYRELPRADYLVTRQSNGTVFVATRDGTNDRNVNVENLEFSDGALATSSIAYQPGFTSVPSSAVQPVFRFYNSRDKAYFYTNSVAERDLIIRESTDASFNPANGVWPYFYQGTTFEQAHSSAGSVPVFRFYNTKTGHHFFTTSVAERDLVQKESTDPNFGQPGLWPFVYEGAGIQAFGDANHKDATPVFRFYSPTLDRHFFTGSADEAAQIRLTGQWNDEGIGFWGEISG